MSQNFNHALERRGSCDSFTSIESPNQDKQEEKNNINDLPKSALESQEQMRKTVRKINILKFLGIFKVKDQNITDSDDAEVFKKIFKVTQKGLIYDQHQYFLQLNSSVMNNHLHRQMSPNERLKHNLFDDEKPAFQLSSSLQAESSNCYLPVYQSPSLTPQTQQNSQTNLKPIKKKAQIRRRSCYCLSSGKQSQKAVKMDFLFPTSLIKNTIYMKVKKKKEATRIFDKDLIISNLNKSFDLQDHSTQSESVIPIERKISNGKFQTNNNNSGSPKQGQQFGVSRSLFFPQSPSPKNNKSSGIIHFHLQSKKQSKIIEEQEIQELHSEKKQEVKDGPKNQSTLNVIQKQEEILKQRKSKEGTFTSQKKPSLQVISNTIGAFNMRVSLSQNNGGATKKSAGEGTNKNIHGNKKSIVTSFDQEGLPGFFEKRKKLLAKLRFATKLVGINQKQKIKSLMSQPEYYNALRDDENEISDDENKEDQGGKKDEQKPVFVKKVKSDHESSLQNAQAVTQQIIDSHNLRFNNTINSFVGSKNKITSSMLSPFLDQNTPLKQSQHSPERNVKTASINSNVISNFKISRDISSDLPQKQHESYFSPFLKMNPLPALSNPRRNYKTIHNQSPLKDSYRFPSSHSSLAEHQNNSSVHGKHETSQLQSGTIDLHASQNQNQQVRIYLKHQNNFKSQDHIQKKESHFHSQQFIPSYNNIQHSRTKKSFDLLFTAKKAPKNYYFSNLSTNTSNINKPQISINMTQKIQQTNIISHSHHSSLHKQQKLQQILNQTTSIPFHPPGYLHQQKLQGSIQ